MSVIHINVSRAIKARWVRQSQAVGLKLTDWIIKALEQTMSDIRIIDAIAEHGAIAVLNASIEHSAGRLEKGLSLVGLEAKSMGDIYRIQSLAYAQMDDAARAIFDAINTAALAVQSKK